MARSSNNPANGGQGWPGTAVVPYVEQLPPPPKKAKERRIRLNTIGEIRSEMAKIIVESRNGKLDTAIATRHIYMLRELAVLIRDHQIEARLEAIEKGNSK